MSIYEIVMLVCFGAAWPLSIHKSWVTRSNRGKSLFFLIILFIGYAAGILHKFFYHYDAVAFLYILNFTMVGIDISLFLRNRRIIEICHEVPTPSPTPSV
jgi:hypothetical protein